MITNTLNQLDHWIIFFPKVVSRLAAAQISAKPSPQKWSKKEIIGHLIDSAQYNLQSLTRANLSEEPYVIHPYPQDDLVRSNHYQKMATSDLLQLWQSLNRQIHQVCTHLSEQDLAKAIVLPDQKQVNLAFLVEDYVAHFEHHLAQIISPQALKLPIEEPNGISYQTAYQKLQAIWSEQKFVTLFRNGSMSLELYIPDKVDLQQPHEQDELYIIVSGKGTFWKEGERIPFEAGDVLYVGAGKEHRFEDFTNDFQTWVVFYGPLGGE